MRISLIGTYHEESGAVTAMALLQILERIQPDVVFAEIPQTHLDAWKDGFHGTLESIAAARYADTHTVDIVPVDLPKPDDSFFRDYQEVIGAIERTSPEFRRLVDLNADRRRQGGFPYLNSHECLLVGADIDRAERETIEYIGTSRLRNMYGQVREVMERRDLEMLRNIRTYCTSTTRMRGAFVVGASHRQSLIEKIRAAGDTATPRIEWDLDGQFKL